MSACRSGRGGHQFVKEHWVVRLPDGFIAYRTDEKELAERRLPSIEKNFPGAELLAESEL